MGRTIEVTDPNECVLLGSRNVCTAMPEGRINACPVSYGDEWESGIYSPPEDCPLRSGDITVTLKLTLKCSKCGSTRLGVPADSKVGKPLLTLRVCQDCGERFSKDWMYIAKSFKPNEQQPCVYANSRYTTETNSPRRHIDNGSGKPLCQTSAKASISFTSSIDIPDCKRCIKIASKGDLK